MKAYVVEITEYNDGSKKEVGIYSYDDKDSAVARFHTKMGGAMGRATVESELLLVVNEDGEVIKDEKFTRQGGQSNG